MYTVLYNCAGDISVDLERDYIRFQEWPAVMSCEKSDLDHTCATSESKPEDVSIHKVVNQSVLHM